jgi:hypothetical protein
VKGKCWGRKRIFRWQTDSKLLGRLGVFFSILALLFTTTLHFNRINSVLLRNCLRHPSATLVDTHSFHLYDASFVHVYVITFLRDVGCKHPSKDRTRLCAKLMMRARDRHTYRVHVCVSITVCARFWLNVACAIGYASIRTGKGSGNDSLLIDTRISANKNWWHIVNTNVVRIVRTPLRR